MYDYYVANNHFCNNQAIQASKPPLPVKLLLILFYVNKIRRKDEVFHDEFQMADDLVLERIL